MRTRHGWIMATTALAAVTVAFLALRRPALERYYLWRFTKGDGAEKHEAAQALGNLRSIRAVPPLFDALLNEGRELSLDSNFEGEMVLPEGEFLDGPYFSAIIECGRDSVPWLRTKLVDPDWLARYCGVRCLWELGTHAEGAVEELCELVADPVPWVRSNAVYALSDISPTSTSSRDAFIHALSQPDEATRWNAVHALREFESLPPEAFEALFNLLRNPEAVWSLREIAAECLGNVGLPAAKALPTLEKLSADPPGLASAESFRTAIARIRRIDQ